MHNNDAAGAGDAAYLTEHRLDIGKASGGILKQKALPLVAIVLGDDTSRRWAACKCDQLRQEQ